MKLVLMRHAEAVEVPENGERPLTAKGHRDAEKMGRMLRSSGWQWTEVRSSPVIRARQTAEHIAPLLHTQHRIDPLLQPGVTPEQFLGGLDGLVQSSAQLCIFHMPDIAYVASRLLGIESSHLFFSPGSALAVNMASRGGECIQIFQYQPDFIG